MSSIMNYEGLFEEVFRDVSPGFFIKPLNRADKNTARYMSLDITENEKEFTIHAELPGIRKEDIQVSIDGSNVVLKAEIKASSKGDKVKFIRQERYFGPITRSVVLPLEINEKESKAKYENGILILTLPKKEGVSPLKLRIE